MALNIEPPPTPNSGPKRNMKETHQEAGKKQILVTTVDGLWGLGVLQPL